MSVSCGCVRGGGGLQKDKFYKTRKLAGRTKTQILFYRKFTWNNLRESHPVLYEATQWAVLFMALAALLHSC